MPHFWVAIEFLYQDRAGDRVEGGGICINICKVHLKDHYFLYQKATHFLQKWGKKHLTEVLYLKVTKAPHFEVLLNFYIRKDQGGSND